MEVLSGLVPTLFAKGLERWSSTKEAEWFKAAIRNRLLREVRLNLEIWKLFDRPKEIPDPSKLAELLSIQAFNEVCTLSLPLSELMGSEPLGADVLRYLRMEEHPNPNKSYQNWVKTIETEVDLIERIWHRLHVLKARHQLGGELGDNAYLMHLLRGLDMSLKEHKTQTRNHKRK